MDLFTEAKYPHIKKPRKPVQVDRKKLTMRILETEHRERANCHAKRTNYLMEMMKFFPEYEAKMYAGAEEADILEAMENYGTLGEDEDGNLLPRFGNVKRARETATIVV